MTTEIIPFQHAGLQRIKRLDSDTDLACDFQNLLVIQTAEEETEDEFWKFAANGIADNFFTYPLVLECKASLDSTKVCLISIKVSYHASLQHIGELYYVLATTLKKTNTLAEQLI